MGDGKAVVLALVAVLIAWVGFAVWIAAEMVLWYSGKKNLPLRNLFMRFYEWESQYRKGQNSAKAQSADERKTA